MTAILKHEADTRAHVPAAHAAPSAMAPAFDPSGLDVIAFAARERRTGKPVCIATVTEIYGTSPRARGS